MLNPEEKFLGSSKVSRKRKAQKPHPNSGGSQGRLWRLRPRVFRQVSEQLFTMRVCQAILACGPQSQEDGDSHDSEDYSLLPGML